MIYSFPSFTFCLYSKTSTAQNIAYETIFFFFYEIEPVGRTYFHMSGFVWRLVLTRRLKTTRKWSIDSELRKRYSYWRYFHIASRMRKCLYQWFLWRSRACHWHDQGHWERCITCHSIHTLNCGVNLFVSCSAILPCSDCLLQLTSRSSLLLLQYWRCVAVSVQIATVLNCSYMLALLTCRLLLLKSITTLLIAIWISYRGQKVWDFLVGLC